jgi:ParB/RepB/Spo0J family partition protein
MVPLWALIPTANQPRQHIDSVELAALAETMRSSTSLFGRQREIITARALTETEQKKYAPARYLIKSGERRWRAASLIELPGVEIRVKEYDSEAEEALDAFMLNENRVGLTDIENARAIAVLARLHGWETQTEIARGIGKDQVWVSQHLALLRLSPKVQARMEPWVPSAARFTRQVGVFLSKLTSTTQDELLEHLPEQCNTGSRQISWMTAELRTKGVTLETRQREPRKIRNRLGNLFDRLYDESDNFLTSQDFSKLFHFVLPEQRTILLHKLHRSEKRFADLAAQVRELADPATKPVSGERPMQDAKKIAESFVAHRQAHAPASESSRRVDVPRATSAQVKQPVLHRTIANPHIISSVTDPPPAVQPKNVEVKRTPEEERMLSWARGITVECMDDKFGRCTLNVLTPYQYISMWDKKKLGFQVEKKPKPAHLPSREQADIIVQLLTKKQK